MAGDLDNKTFGLDGTWDPRATVRPGTEPDGELDPEALGWTPREGAYVLAGTIGQGGMGVVRAATQRALDREVAVKTLSAGQDDPRARRRLVREAWVTGSLEHPNIVPVYDLGRDEGDRPYLVLKRIEGTPWSELIADEAAVRERFGVTDVLEWHLRVLVQLCNAVAFAHSRGVIHRDLKPDNVMVGAFGEVYLLDWGLALSIDEATARLPPAARQTRFAGTPSYLAPEQLGDSELPLGTWTDVYLLGGMLYEVLHGEPPHRGGSLDAVLRSARRSEPEVADRVPSSLAELLRRTLAREPERRPATATELRRELLGYLERRHADQLVERTVARLSELQAALLVEEPDDATDQRIRDLLGACRFGFNQALEADPLHSRARTGLATALTAVARRALDRDDLSAAALLLDELDDSPQHLVEELGAARRERDELQARRAALELSLDPTVGVRGRMLLMSSMGLGWTLLPLLLFWPLGTEPSWPEVWLQPVLLLAMALALIAVGNRQFTRTAVSRVLRGLALVAPVSQVVLLGVVYQLELSASLGLAFTLAGWSVMAMMGSIWYGPGVWPLTMGYGAAAVVGVRYPAWASALMAAACAAMTLNLFLYRVPDLIEARRRYLGGGSGG